MTRPLALRAPSLALAIMAPTLLSTSTSADVLDFIITLDGDQEVPVVDTASIGAGTATFDTDTNLFSWDITFENLSAPESAAHFHGPAPLCEEAGPQITLPAGATKIGSMALSAGQAVDLLAGLWYVNIHSTAHAGGEIRGQALPTELADPVPAGIPASALHVVLEPVASGLTAPNWGVHAPGDTLDRLFVTDQSGVLWAIDTATGEKAVFLDASAFLVSLGLFGPDTFDERGLLSVAFHPQYASNGKLYTYTSEPATKSADFSTMPLGVDANHQTVIREWVVPTPADPASVVDPNSTRALLRIDQPQFNHNAGAIAFDQAGDLYIALGDGGGADDRDGQDFIVVDIVGHGCLGNGRDAETILGSVLRIDVDGNDAANGAYGIPAGNPFTGADPRLDEIFAYGFRNPFRMSFDALTDDLYVADVGQNHLEEINVVVNGGHYGWNEKEGTFPFIVNGNQNGYASSRPLPVSPGLVDPIAQYDHDEGIAIVGGFVYRGTRIGPLAGRYVFGEFAMTFSNDGRLFHLDDGNEIVEFQLVGPPALGLSLLGFAQDAAGELYVLANSTGTPFGTTGVVLRITTRPGDIDANGAVQFDDLLAVLSTWGPCPGCPEDLNNDGIVGFDDLLVVLSNFD